MEQTLQALFFQVLMKVEEKIHDLKFSWGLIGSMNHYIQGIDIIPKDIDLITTREGVFAISECLKEFEIQKSEFLSQHSIRSYYGVFKVQEIRIEVMGEIEYLLADGHWHTHENWSENIICVTLGDITIPCIALHYELAIYSKLGYTQRAALIREKIENPI